MKKYQIKNKLIFAFFIIMYSNLINAQSETEYDNNKFVTAHYICASCTKNSSDLLSKLEEYAEKNLTPILENSSGKFYFDKLVYDPKNDNLLATYYYYSGQIPVKYSIKKKHYIREDKLTGRRYNSKKNVKYILTNQSRKNCEKLQSEIGSLQNKYTDKPFAFKICQKKELIPLSNVLIKNLLVQKVKSDFLLKKQNRLSEKDLSKSKYSFKTFFSNGKTIEAKGYLESEEFTVTTPLYLSKLKFFLKEEKMTFKQEVYINSTKPSELVVYDGIYSKITIHDLKQRYTKDILLEELNPNDLNYIILGKISKRKEKSFLKKVTKNKNKKFDNYIPYIECYKTKGVFINDVLAQLEEGLYSSIKETRDVSELKKYMKYYPNGRYFEKIRGQIPAVEEYNRIDKISCFSYKDIECKVKKYIEYDKYAKKFKEYSYLSHVLTDKRNEIEQEFYNGQEFKKISTSSLYIHISEREKLIDYAERRNMQKLVSRLNSDVSEIKAIIENRFYQDAISNRTLKTCEKYLNKYPKGKYKDNIITLIEQITYESAKSLSALRHYLTKYPKGKFVKDAEKELQRREENSFKNAKTKNSKELYQSYIRDFPRGKYIQEAKAMIDEKTFKVAAKDNTKKAYQDYVRKFPNGKYIQEAKDNISKLDEKAAYDYALSPLKQKGMGNKLDERYEKYNSYLKKYPNSTSNYAKEVNRQIDILEVDYYQFVVQCLKWKTYSGVVKSADKFLKYFPNSIYDKDVKQMKYLSEDYIAVKKAEHELKKRNKTSGSWVNPVNDFLSHSVKTISKLHDDLFGHLSTGDGSYVEPPCYEIIKKEKDTNLFFVNYRYELKCRSGLERTVYFNSEKGKYTYGIPTTSKVSLHEAAEDVCGCSN